MAVKYRHGRIIICRQILIFAIPNPFFSYTSKMRKYGGLEPLWQVPFPLVVPELSCQNS